MQYKKILSAVIALELAVCSSGIALSAEELSEEIAVVTEAETASVDIPQGSVIIDENTFPCRLLRMFLLKFYKYETCLDASGNVVQYMTPEQISNVHTIYISQSEPDYDYRVTDLTGIELLPELKRIVIKGDDSLGYDIKKIDVSKNTKLQELNISYCRNVEELKLGYHPDLTVFKCSMNKLSSVDFSAMPNVTEITADNNNIRNFDFSGLSKLQSVSIENNLFDSVDLSGCSSLVYYFGSDKKTGGTLTSLDFTDCTQLQNVYFNSCGVTSFACSSKVLNTLYCNHNGLKTLDLSACSSLDTLQCYDNALTSLKLPRTSSFTKLSAYKNALTSVDLSGCTGLAEADISNNLLTSVALPSSAALKTLKVGNNSLKKIDVSGCTGLEKLYVENNMLAALDLSKCKALTALNAYDNSFPIGDVVGTYDLSKLKPYGFDISKTSEWKYADFDSEAGTISYFTDNSVTYKYNTGSSLSSAASVSFKLTASSYKDKDYFPLDEEHVPDENFRAILSGSLYDTNQDGVISEKEASKITYLSLSNKGITDFKGIEYLTSLETFSSYDNKIASLDLSNNLCLKTVTVNNSAVTWVKLGNNKVITSLSINGGAMTGRLDLSAYSTLTKIAVSNNKLTSLILPATSAAIMVSAIKNCLPYVDMSVCPNGTISVSGNAYDIGNPGSSFALSSIPGFDASKATSWRGAAYNASTGCIENFTSDTIYYDYALGNGSTGTFILSRSENSPVTYTISGVSSPTAGGTVTIGKTSAASGTAVSISASPASGYKFSKWTVTGTGASVANPTSATTTLTVGSSNVTVTAVFEKIAAATYTISKVSSPTAGGTVTIGKTSAASGTAVSISASPASGYKFSKWTVTGTGASVANPTSASTTLTVGSSNVTVTAVFEKITAATYTISKVSSPTAGGTVTLGKTSAASGTAVSISASPASGYKFSKWTVTGTGASVANPSSASTTLTVGSSNVTVTAVFTAETVSSVALDTAHFPDSNFLAYVSKYFDKDSSGDLSKEEIANAKYIGVAGSNITSLKGIEYLTEITELSCGINSISEIDLSRNKKLEKLFCSANQIAFLDLSKNTLLTEINCSNNNMTDIRLPSGSALTKLNISFNQLTSVDLSGCTGLTSLTAYNNAFPFIDVSKCPSGINVYATSNTYKAFGSGTSYSLSELIAKGFDTSRISSLSGAQLSSSGTSFINITSDITYYYDIGNGTKVKFTVSLRDPSNLTVSDVAAMPLSECIAYVNSFSSGSSDVIILNDAMLSAINRVLENK